ncbi:ABC transporter permease subunit [Spirochaeta dissipatitropha]
MNTIERQTGKAFTPVPILYMLSRGLILFSCLAMFFPAFNPARISDRIGRGVSLFTTGVSYAGLTSRFERAFIQGWVDRSVFVLLMIAAVIIIIGVILCAIGACMSLGNNRMRLSGHKYPLIGSLVMMAGLTGVYFAYLQLVTAGEALRLEPSFPSYFSTYLTISVILLLVSITITMFERYSGEELEKESAMPEKYSLFLMLLPIIVLVFLFSYLPLWGWRYAFYDYTAGGVLSRENFVGFKWFTFLFQNRATLNDLLRVMRNTLVMSGLGIVTSWLPVAFAICLHELRSSKLRRVVQTFTTIPNFISWVLVYAIALAIFSTDGFLNSMLDMLAGSGNRTNWLMTGDNTWIKMLLWGTWKSVGWSAIVYIAAIAGIDPQLYEAATIDGAGRYQKIIHIVIPGILPTYLVLLLLQIAGVLSNGLEQYLVFLNPLNKDTIEVLDLYVYNIGINDGRIPLSTVVSMAKSVISVALLFIANRASKIIRGHSII